MQTPALSDYYVTKCDELRALIADAEQTVAQLRACAEEGTQFAMENGAGDLVNELNDLISAVSMKEKLDEDGERTIHLSESQLLEMFETDEPTSAVEKVNRPKGKSRENRELKRLYRQLCHLLHPDKSKLENSTEIMSEVIRLYKLHDIEGVRAIYTQVTSKVIVTSETIVRETIDRYERTLRQLRQEMMVLKETPGFTLYQLWKQASDDDMAIVVIRNVLESTISSIRRRYFRPRTTFTFNSPFFR